MSGPVNPAPKPSRLRFDPNDLLRFGDGNHVYVRPIEAGHVLRRHGGVLEEAFTHDDMASIVARGDFVHQRGFYAETGAFARDRSGVTSLNDLPPEERATVLWKMHWCEAFLKLEAEGKAKRSDVSMQAAIDDRKAEALKLDIAKICEGEKARKKRSGTASTLREAPCPRTLRNWLKVYEAADYRPDALRDGYRRCGNKTARLAPEVYALLVKHAKGFVCEKRPTLVKLQKDLEIELEALNAERKAHGLPALDAPSIKILRKAVGRLPVFAVYAGRHGLTKARRRFGFVTGAPEATRPGERTEMDEWSAHLQKILTESGEWATLSDDQRRLLTGRMMVCFNIDCATRCVLGVAVAPTATGALAKATLKACVSDKSLVAAAAGAVTPWDMALNPEMVVTDGGSGLTSDECVTAIRDLGARHDVPPGGNPGRRGHNERLLRTVDLNFAPHFTGRTFSDVSEKGDYDAQLRASLTVEIFSKALVRWIVDVYHNTPHEGLGGETPRNAWIRLSGLFGIITPPGPDQRRAIFGIELERVVTLRGIEFLGLHYLDRDLAEDVMTRGAFTATIRVDEDDLGAVSLRIGDGWRRLPCRTEGAAGTSLAVWIATAADLRRRFADQAAMTRDVVLDAIAAIKGMARDAERSVGIHRTAPTAAELKRIEDEVLCGFAVPTDREPDAAAPAGDPGDPFSRAMPTGDGGGGNTPPPPTADAAAPDPTPPRRRDVHSAPSTGLAARRNFKIEE